MERLNAWLAARREAGTFRELLPLERLGRGRIRLAGAVEGRDLIDFSSNDYLALAQSPELLALSREWLERYGSSSGAARLMSGDLELHHHLETATARFKGREAALLFGSGYLANVGVIPALAGRGDVILIDRLAHASIYDGCRLSGARLLRFRHNDLNHLEELLRRERGRGQCLIVVESIYSMDGDRCPLPELVSLKNRFSCLLMVDEAHASGIFGPHGGGVIEADGVSAEVDIAMGTFGKALGSYGAYVAGSREMMSYLVNRARTFIYSTALPPAVLGASLAALEVVRTRPELRQELQRKIIFFKKCLAESGITADLGVSQIVPLLVGDSRLALHYATELRQQGIFATAVRPPTVPEGTARLRFSITRHHDEATLAEASRLIAAMFVAKG